MKLLGEPAIPQEERIDARSRHLEDQAEPISGEFSETFVRTKILREFAGCCEEFTGATIRTHGIAEAVVTSAVKLR